MYNKIARDKRKKIRIYRREIEKYIYLSKVLFIQKHGLNRDPAREREIERERETETETQRGRESV